jgi:hypothetical protein
MENPRLLLPMGKQFSHRADSIFVVQSQCLARAGFRIAHWSSKRIIERKERSWVYGGPGPVLDLYTSVHFILAIIPKVSIGYVNCLPSIVSK